MQIRPITNLLGGHWSPENVFVEEGPQDNVVVQPDTDDEHHKTNRLK